MGQKKFLCGHKNKVGINCQAVSDCCGCILDMSMNYSGAFADCLSFKACALHFWLENSFDEERFR